MFLADPLSSHRTVVCKEVKGSLRISVAEILIVSKLLRKITTVVSKSYNSGDNPIGETILKRKSVL
jgi:hypothetical protein